MAFLQLKTVDQNAFKKSLELLDLTSIPEVVPAHMCFTHTKSMQSEKKSNLNHFKIDFNTSLMILEKL